MPELQNRIAAWQARVVARARFAALVSKLTWAVERARVGLIPSQPSFHSKELRDLRGNHLAVREDQAVICFQLDQLGLTR
jgi:hypothetical protein